MPSTIPEIRCTCWVEKIWTRQNWNLVKWTENYITIIIVNIERHVNEEEKDYAEDLIVSVTVQILQRWDNFTKRSNTPTNENEYVHEGDLNLTEQWLQELLIVEVESNFLWSRIQCVEWSSWQRNISWSSQLSSMTSLKNQRLVGTSMSHYSIEFEIISLKVNLTMNGLSAYQIRDHVFLLYFEILYTIRGKRLFLKSNRFLQITRKIHKSEFLQSYEKRNVFLRQFWKYNSKYSK